MQLGLIGLGKMGGNMRERVRRAGHEVVGYDTNPEVSDVESVQAMVEALQTPRVVWVMVPAGEVTRAVIADLAERLEPGDLVIDGGNSLFTDTIRREKEGRTVRYFLNPGIATHIPNASARKAAREGAGPLLRIMEGGKP